MAFLKVTLLLLVLASVQGFFLPRHSAKSEDLAYHKHHSRYHDTSGPIRSRLHTGFHDHDQDDHATRTIVTHADEEPHDDHHHVRTVVVKETGIKNHPQGILSALFGAGGHKDSRTTVHHHHVRPAPRHRHHVDHHVDQHRTLWK